MDEQKKSWKWSEKNAPEIARRERKRRNKKIFWYSLLVIGVIGVIFYYATRPKFVLNQPMKQNENVSIRKEKDTSPKRLWDGETPVGAFQIIEDKGGFVLVANDGKYGTYSLNPFVPAMSLDYQKPEELKSGDYKFKDGKKEYIVHTASGKQALKAFDKVKDIFDGLAIVSENGQEILVKFSLQAPLVIAPGDDKAKAVADKVKTEIVKLNSTPVTLSVQIGGKFYLYSVDGKMLNATGFFGLEAVDGKIKAFTNQKKTVSRTINPETGK